MSGTVKNQEAILKKLGIEKLNSMQEEAILAITSSSETVLLSPTGSGKTLAFLLPIFQNLDRSIPEVQALIIAPSRELAIQIEQVARELGTGYKTNVVYGGRPFSKEKTELRHAPAILIGTPGRIADHIRRDSISVTEIATLVLDEFDKSLEVGFEGEMSEIVSLLPNVSNKILTSATQGVKIPGFMRMQNPLMVDFLHEKITSLAVKKVVSPEKDKLDTLVDTLRFVGDQNGIIFCNFKDSISRVSDYLHEKEIPHGVFYGGMEQKDRERSLIKFRNGTYKILIATDLAARGIDVPELNFIIHYHLPIKKDEFTHRNGRTARMNSDGTAYVLTSKYERLPDFINDLHLEEVDVLSGIGTKKETAQNWTTLFISGGRKDKISKGDIAGLFFQQGKLKPDELGTIELKTDCAFVAVPENKAKHVIQKLNNTKLKKKKIRVTHL